MILEQHALGGIDVDSGQPLPVRSRRLVLTGRRDGGQAEPKRYYPSEVVRECDTHARAAPSEKAKRPPSDRSSKVVAAPQMLAFTVAGAETQGARDDRNPAAAMPASAQAASSVGASPETPTAPSRSRPSAA